MLKCKSFLVGTLMVGIVLMLVSALTVVQAGDITTFTFYHDNPEQQARWEKIGEMSAKSIGIKMDPVPFKVEPYMTRIKMDITTSRAPGLFKWWFGFRAREFVEAGLAEDLSGVWDEAGQKVLPGVRQALTMEGITYAIPQDVSFWVWFYNKPLLEKYGFKLPETWDEFISQLEFFHSKGISGIGHTFGKSRWRAFIMFQELMERVDAHFYNDLAVGKAHWTDEPAVEAMRIWSTMLKKGFFAPMDARYVEDYPKMFLEGSLAYVPMGSWYSGTLRNAGLKSGEDYGITILPPITAKGKRAICTETGIFIVPKNSPQKEIAKKWAKWWLSSPEAAEFRLEQFKWAPWEGIVPIERLAKTDPVQAYLLGEALKPYDKVLIRFWEVTPVPIVEKSLDEFQKVMAFPDKYIEALNEMEKTAAEVWADRGVKYQAKLLSDGK